MQESDSLTVSDILATTLRIAVTPGVFVSVSVGPGLADTLIISRTYDIHVSLDTVQVVVDHEAACWFVSAISASPVAAMLVIPAGVQVDPADPPRAPRIHELPVVFASEIPVKLAEVLVLALFVATLPTPVVLQFAVVPAAVWV
jgi:hypothetical protein